VVESLLLRCFVAGAPAPVAPATVIAVLRRLAVDVGPDGVGGLYAGDGGTGSIDVSGLKAEGGLVEATVTVETLTAGLADLVHEIAAETGMTVTATGGSTVYLVDGDHVDHLPSALAEHAHTCVDGAELLWWVVREARRSANPDAPSEPTPRNEAVTRSDAIRSLFGVFRRD
jgi:hypothetical protein